MSKWWLFASLLGALLSGPQGARAQTATQRSAARQRTLPKPATTSAAEQQRFKGIFEPVNYNQDLTLFDAFFVSSEEGWVSGAAGTILHTVDGGKTWTAQLGGDPHSEGPELKRIFFLDRTHGWAQSWNQLFRTTDGENWQEVGNDVRGYAVFVSPQKGFRVYGSTLYATRDAGATWKEAFTCRVRAQVGGLNRDLNCEVYALQFVSTNVGYGVGTSNENGSLAVKTTDGGVTWNVVSLTQEPGDQRTFTLFFFDEQNGFATRQTKLFQTADGGKTWQGVMATLPPGMAPQLQFADPEVGWSCGGSHFAFTVDAGKHWTSRTIRFPAEVTGFSLPRRDRGYVVGTHGMIYRYRVVPVNYQAPAHSIDAPAMPGFDSPVFGEVATLNDVVAELRDKLPAPAPGPSGGQGSGFQQDTGAPSSGGAGAAPNPTAGTQPAGPGGFQQDAGTGPVPGGYVDSCCGPLIQQLETTANLFSTHVPAFSQRFRNLNLIFQGLNFLNSAVNQANTLKQSIRALRQAKNSQAAAAALNTVSTQVNGISSSGGFVQDTSLPPPR